MTSSNIPNAEKVPTTKSTLWQEEMRGKDQPDGSSSISPAQSPIQSQAMLASSMKEPMLESKEGKDQRDAGSGFCSPLPSQHSIPDWGELSSSP